MTALPQIEGVTDLREIGRGGFGVVYRGTETEFDRDVAVKVLSPSLDDHARRRFERERRAMGAVSGHPNIVTVYRGGLTASNQPYLIMEYVRGGSLADHLQAVGPIGWKTAAAIGAKLAEALTDAHRAGILHRDVKPGNVFMTESGEPKLGDFGIARLDDGHETKTGSITASVAHAAPEIVDGQRGDERSDLYSLASTVYALAVGFAPFSRDPNQGLASLLSRISNEAPPPLRLEHEAAAFEATLMRALAKRPEQRHPTVAEFGSALRASTLTPTPSDRSAQAGSSDADTTLPVGLHSPIDDGFAAEAKPTRATSRGQVVALALLAVLIAGFGGWAVARAVLDSDSTAVTSTPAASPGDPSVPPTAAPDGSAGEPTIETAETPTAEPPTPAPSATVAPAPTATEPPPTSTPPVTRGANNLGSDIAGFSQVTDFSGAITVEVPTAWTTTVQDAEGLPLDEEGLPVRVLAVGGTVQELSGDPEVRDLELSGIYVFAARFDEPTNSAELLDGALSFWSDCTLGDRAQILLTDGNADYQILQCARSSGDLTGVVALALIPQEDRSVAVTVFLQFADVADLASLPTILQTISIDTNLVPDLTTG